MDNKSETREFLTTRRAKITPEMAGLPNYSTSRRVPGLRREEVALLAGVSVDYYTRLERGDLNGASEDVLEALARALQLDEAEHAHLFDLARVANNSPSARRRPQPTRLRAGVQRVLDALTDAPAMVRNQRMDLLGANKLGHALYSDVFNDVVRPPNTARFTYLNPKSHDFFVDWEDAANNSVGILRAEAGRNPYDRELSNLIGELSTRSDDFRKRWAAHNVRFHRTGTKRLNHPVVGPLDLTYEALEIAADGGLVMNVYSAEPASATADALKLLASWVAPAADAEEHDLTQVEKD